MIDSCGGYHEYIGGGGGRCLVNWRDISISRGHLEYIGRCSVHQRDIKIDVGHITSNSGEYHDSCGDVIAKSL